MNGDITVFLLAVFTIFNPTEEFEVANSRAIAKDIRPSYTSFYLPFQTNCFAATIEYSLEIAS